MTLSLKIKKLILYAIVLTLVVGCGDEDIIDTNPQAYKHVGSGATAESVPNTESFERYPSAIQVNFSMSNFMGEPLIFHSITYNQHGQQYDGHDYEYLNGTSFAHEIHEPDRAFAQLRVNHPQMDFKVAYNYTVNGELRNAIYGVQFNFQDPLYPEDLDYMENLVIGAGTSDFTKSRPGDSLSDLDSNSTHAEDRRSVTIRKTRLADAPDGTAVFNVICTIR